MSFGRGSIGTTEQRYEAECNDTPPRRGLPLNLIKIYNLILNPPLNQILNIPNLSIPPFSSPTTWLVYLTNENDDPSTWNSTKFQLNAELAITMAPDEAQSMMKRS